MASAKKFGGLLAGFVAGIVWMVACGGDDPSNVTPVDAQTPAGVQRVVTADTDPTRIESGNAYRTLAAPYPTLTCKWPTTNQALAAYSTCVSVISGPFVLTDFYIAPHLGGDNGACAFVVTNPNEATQDYFVPRWTRCVNTSSMGYQAINTPQPSGTRFLVKEGEQLLIVTASTPKVVAWSGFRPY
jgi:hypothetical protein